jgi:hypothetical protein
MKADTWMTLMRGIGGEKKSPEPEGGWEPFDGGECPDCGWPKPDDQTCGRCGHGMGR